MNRVFIHNKYTSDKLIKTFFGFFIIYVLYGFYKNGLLQYNSNANLFVLFRPLVLPIVSVVVTLGFNKIFKENFWGYRSLCNILISIISFPNTNILIYIILIILLNLIFDKVNINIVSLYMVIYSIILIIINKYTYLNIIEKSIEHNYSFFDYLLGRSSGGISNTLIFFTLIFFIILCLNFLYKRQIPIVALSTYYILILFTSLFKGFSLNFLLNSNLLFAFVFIVPISPFSPYSKGACYIYGFVLGLFAYISSFWDLSFGIYLTITILSLLKKYFDDFIVNKTNKNLVDVL